MTQQHFCTACTYWIYFIDDILEFLVDAEIVKSINSLAKSIQSTIHKASCPSYVGKGILLPVHNAKLINTEVIGDSSAKRPTVLVLHS